MTRLFPHERLLAYQRARQFYRQVVGFRSRMFRGLGDLYDQLLRASSSVCLNLAEGAASYTPGSKLRHFRIALASAGECACALDQLEDQRVLGERDLAEARSLLTEAAALTVGLIRRLAEPQEVVADDPGASDPSSLVG